MNPALIQINNQNGLLVNTIHNTYDVVKVLAILINILSQSLNLNFCQQQTFLYQSSQTNTKTDKEILVFHIYPTYQCLFQKCQSLSFSLIRNIHQYLGTSIQESIYSNALAQILSIVHLLFFSLQIKFKSRIKYYFLNLILDIVISHKANKIANFFIQPPIIRNQLMQIVKNFLNPLPSIKNCEKVINQLNELVLSTQTQTISAQKTTESRQTLSPFQSAKSILFNELRLLQNDLHVTKTELKNRKNAAYKLEARCFLVSKPVASLSAKLQNQSKEVDLKTTQPEAIIGFGKKRADLFQQKEVYQQQRKKLENEVNGLAQALDALRSSNSNIGQLGRPSNAAGGERLKAVKNGPFGDINGDTNVKGDTNYIIIIYYININQY